MGTVQTYYSRQYAPVNWPWNTNVGGTAVGLFSFIYHEFVPAFAAEFGMGIDGPFPLTFLLRYALTAALTRGLQPVYGIWMTPFAPVMAAAAAYGPAFSTWARFLFTARTVVPPAVLCSATTGEQDNITIALSNAAAGAFIDDDDGTLAVVLAQSTNASLPVTLDFSNWLSPPQVITCVGNVTEFNANGTALATWPALPDTVARTLQPHDVRVYTINGCSTQQWS